MTFWQVTMKRSLSLSKTYVIIAVGLAVYGTILSNLIPLLPSNIPTSSTTINLTDIFPTLSVAFFPLSALLFSLPVIMLFVLDKNSGIFEYLLSTGMDQLDVFKGYMISSLVLAVSILTFAVILNTVLGLYMGTSGSLLASIAVLTFAVGISTVFLVTVCMIAFSSLQKTRTGANQPLGVSIGVIPVFPALILPIVFPSYALIIDVSIAGVISASSVGLLFSISRLIKREKLLP